MRRRIRPVESSSVNRVGEVGAGVGDGIEGLQDPVAGAVVVLIAVAIIVAGIVIVVSGMRRANARHSRIGDDSTRFQGTFQRRLIRRQTRCRLRRSNWPKVFIFFLVVNHLRLSSEQQVLQLLDGPVHKGEGNFFR